MPFTKRLTSTWRNLFSARRADHDLDLDEEISTFVDLLVEEKQKSGMSRDEARKQALLEVGGTGRVKEKVREARSGSLLETILRDIAFGFRMLVKNPGFTVAAVLALALGIGANTAMFSVVNAVLLRPLPYSDPDRLVVILHGGNSPAAPANYLDWQRQSTAFETMGAAEVWGPNLSGTDRPEHISAMHVTHEIFPMLGVAPALGRSFFPEEDSTGRDHSAVLSYGLWQRRFGADPNVLGKSVRLDGESYTIVGVMPEGFKFAPFWATKADLWAPLAFGEDATKRKHNTLRIFARLRRGVPIEQAQAEITAITERLEREFPRTNADVRVVSLKEKVVGNVRPALLVLLTAVGFVLLIACANVAHMLMARAAARQREIAVRSALGASRSRIIRQFLTESVLLALLSGLAGFLLSEALIATLRVINPGNIPRVQTVSLDLRVLAVMMAITILTGIAFGLVPALSASDVNLSDALKDAGRNSGAGRRSSKFRSLLLASEFSFAFILLIGAGLMIRSFLALQSIDPGFNPKNILSMVLSVAGSNASDPARRNVFYHQVVERVEALPGVESASMINHVPLAGDVWGRSFLVEGLAAPDNKHDTPRAVYRSVLPGYFRTMQISLSGGRDFTQHDDKGAPLVIVVNESLARAFWPQGDAIGKRMTFDDKVSDKSEWLTVVGVVKDVKQDGWATEPQHELYLPFMQDDFFRDGASFAASSMSLVVRSKGDAASLVQPIDGEIHSLDSNVPLSEVETMEQVVAESNAAPRLYLLVLGTFAVVALVLAVVGIYGVISYSVTRRTQEIGIRIALGATRGQVLGMVLRGGMLIAGMGGVIGLLGALLLTRLMQSLLYGVTTTDPLTFVVVPLLLTLAALAASLVPARRATRIDPMIALRNE